MKRFVKITGVLSVVVCGVILTSACQQSEEESRQVNLLIKCYSEAGDEYFAPCFEVFEGKDSVPVNTSSSYNRNDSTLTINNLSVGADYIVKLYSNKYDCAEYDDDNAIREELVSSNGVKITGVSGNINPKIPADKLRWLNVAIPDTVKSTSYFVSEKAIALD